MCRKYLYDFRATLRAGDDHGLTGRERQFTLGLVMGRTITLLCAVWAFSIPSLCTSGLLVHPCDCESPAGCGHETECSDDPCNVTFIVQNGSSARTFDLYELVAVPLDDAPLVAVEATLRSFALRFAEPPGPFDRPHAESDLPLLI